jgi:hypothetical protein
MKRREMSWFLTLANASVASLLVFVVRNVILVAGLASEIIMWPLYTLLLTVLTLSVLGLVCTRAVVSRAWRYFAFGVNGSALVFDLLIVFGLALLFFGATVERFIIPENYKGEVYVIYGVPGCESPGKTRREVTYRIPNDGVLCVREPMVVGWTRSEYYYQAKQGKLKHIDNYWASTIDPSPENLANSSDIGVFFPRVGRFSNASGCSAEFQMFYVGTKAHLLTNYKPLDLTEYLTIHPEDCTPGRNEIGLHELIRSKPKLF